MRPTSSTENEEGGNKLLLVGPRRGWRAVGLSAQRLQQLARKESKAVRVLQKRVGEATTFRSSI